MKTAGHPKGLYVLFFTEAWERFSYYGMRALLVLYMTKHLSFAREDALEVYGIYTSLVYLTPLIGGYLTDRYLGQRKAILIGGFLMALGHFAMAFESLLYYALGLLMVGNGFFKPNISTLVGTLYEEKDERRDGAYTIFYMGINLGAFFSPLVCGTLGERVGWHVGFSCAGIGMVVGLCCFLFFSRHLGTAGFPPGREATADSRLTLRDWRHVAIGTLAGLAFVMSIVQALPAISLGWNTVLGWPLALQLLVVLAACGLLYFGTRKKEADCANGEKFTREEWHQMVVIIVVTMFSVMFWMGFEQAGGTMTLFADEKTELPALPKLPVPPELPLVGNLLKDAAESFNALDVMPASAFQAVNPFWIVALGPFFSMLWSWLDRNRYRVSPVTKQAFGLIFLGLGFVVMRFADRHYEVVGKVGWQWLFAVYTIHTLGELCLSPIGLSLVSKLAPCRVASLMMAIWFLSSFAANYVAAKLEEYLKILETTRHIEINLWYFLVGTSVGPGIVLLLLTPLLNRMMHGKA